MKDQMEYFGRVPDFLNDNLEHFQKVASGFMEFYGHFINKLGDYNLKLAVRSFEGLPLKQPKRI